MKILMLITQLGYGGAEGAFLRLARELSRWHEVELVVFTKSYGGSYTDVPHESSHPLHVLDHQDRAGRVGRWVRRWRELRKLKAAFAADVTISFLSGPNLLNVLARGHGRQVVSLRGSRRFDANSPPATRWLYRWFADPLIHRLADKVVCVSEGLAREVGGRSAATSMSKFVAISGYVDSERLLATAVEPVEPEFERLRKLPVIIAAGRLSTEKGFQHLVRLFAEVRTRVPVAKLLLIGDGPARVELQRIAERHGLSHGCVAEIDRDVLFAGYRAFLSRYFRLGSVFVLPSASEGFPNVLVEAMASGVPIVAGDVPWGVREVFGDPADAHNRPHPRSTPLATPYGLLMPRIDDPEFEGQWIEALEGLLTSRAGPEADPEPRKTRVRELDCSVAAGKWDELLQSVVSAHL